MPVPNVVLVIVITVVPLVLATYLAVKKGPELAVPMIFLSAGIIILVLTFSIREVIDNQMMVSGSLAIAGGAFGAAATYVGVKK